MDYEEGQNIHTIDSRRSSIQFPTVKNPRETVSRQGQELGGTGKMTFCIVAPKRSSPVGREGVLYRRSRAAQRMMTTVYGVCARV